MGILKTCTLFCTIRSPIATTITSLDLHQCIPGVVLLCLPRTAPILPGLGGAVPVPPLNPPLNIQIPLDVRRTMVWQVCQRDARFISTGPEGICAYSVHLSAQQLRLCWCRRWSTGVLHPPDQAVGRDGEVVCPRRRVLCLQPWGLGLSAGGSGLWDDLLLWHYEIMV